MKTPSEAQINFANEISFVLGVDFPMSSKDYTAKAYYEFIRDHINRYQNAMSGDPNWDDDFWIHEPYF